MVHIQVEVVGKGILNLDMEVDDRDTAIQRTLMRVEDQLSAQLHLNQIGQFTIDGELVEPERILNQIGQFTIDGELVEPERIWDLHQRYEVNSGFWRRLRER